MSTPVHYANTLIAAAKAIGLAAVINAVLFFTFFSFKLIDPRVPVAQDGTGMAINNVVFATVINMAVGTVIFLLLLRFSNQPVRIFSWICLIATLLFLMPPFLAAMPTPMALAVNILHLPPAYLLWRFLTRSVVLLV